MKSTSKLTLLMAAGLVAAVPGQAQIYGNGDLLVGFTGGSSDFIYDLGQSSSLTPGLSWTVGTGLGTQFGVVGAQSNGRVIYATSSGLSEGSFNPTALYPNARGNVATLSGQPTALTLGGSRTPAPSDTTSWFYQTDQPAGTSGNTFQNNFLNPNVAAGSTAYFYDNGNDGSIFADGFFTYNSANGVVTYVPEPATISLLAGAGLLLGLLRRQQLVKP